jgi:hypothetical protein
MFADVAFILGNGPVHEGANASARPNTRPNGMLMKWIKQVRYRSLLVSNRRNVISIPFLNPPKLTLRWSEPGHCVAVFLNGEPWAFIQGDKTYGYSKGNLKGGYGNVWDQQLFEKMFNNI